MIWNILLYGVLFLAGLVLLEKGADLFTDKLGELCERTGVSETVLGLLTAGMEWEELLVSLVAAFSGNIGIAVGNVIGASIANILGTFSLGPLIKPLTASKDDRFYALILGIITTGVAALLLSQLSQYSSRTPRRMSGSPASLRPAVLFPVPFLVPPRFRRLLVNRLE